MYDVFVRSYIRVSANKFSPIEEVGLADIRDYHVGGGSNIISGNYIPGAVKIDIYGEPFMTFDLWDDVNYVWWSIIDCLSNCFERGVGAPGFPDQSIDINMIHIAKPDILKLWISSGEEMLTKKFPVETEEFLKALKPAGRIFHTEISRFTLDTFEDAFKALEGF